MKQKLIMFAVLVSLALTTYCSYAVTSRLFPKVITVESPVSRHTQVEVQNSFMMKSFEAVNEFLDNCRNSKVVDGTRFCHLGNYEISDIPGLVLTSEITGVKIMFGTPWAEKYVYHGTEFYLYKSLYVEDIGDLSDFWDIHDNLTIGE